MAIVSNHLTFHDSLINYFIIHFSLTARPFEKGCLFDR